MMGLSPLVCFVFAKRTPRLSLLRFFAFFFVIIHCILELFVEFWDDVFGNLGSVEEEGVAESG